MNDNGLQGGKEMFLEIKDLKKGFGSGDSRTEVLRGIDFSVEKGEFCVLLGPSGSGKSTLLNIIGGIDEPDEGYISIDGEKTGDMKEKALTLYRRKHLGYVFQMYNLIPNLNVKENIEVGAYLSDKALDIDELLHTLGLYEHRHKLPNQLSGGQQQRIALARALVISPDVLLMDEPLSNLDAKLRVEMRSVIRHTQKSVGITTVYVTHDQEEAMAISDRIAVMKDGVIQHVGTPRDIYQRPKNVFVATFIGRTNIVNAHVKDGIITFADGYHEHIDALDKAAEQDVRCSIRPEEFIICKDGTDGIHGTVQECTYLGLNTHYTIDTDQGDSVEIVEESSIGEGLKKGEKVLLKVKKEKINVFTKDGGTNLIRSDAYEKQ